jgi:hypothetical protein
VRGVGYPSTGNAEFGGRTLNALSRKVEVPFPGTHDGVHPPITQAERRRVEQFIGCTIEQSYSEFTVELKNALHRMLADIANVDHSRPARHRGHRSRERYSKWKVS